MKTLLDLIDSADLMEIDDKSIRYFGLDVDGVEEEDGDDGVILIVEMRDESFEKWDWYFTIKELKEAVYYPTKKEWLVQYGIDDYPTTIKLYTLTQIIPEGYL